MNIAVVAAVLGVAFILLLSLVKWRWKVAKLPPGDDPPSSPILVHRLCPHHNVVQGFVVEEKDSLDEHLDILSRKLAEKEGRLRLSKYKIHETQQEIESLHAIDHDVKIKYQDCMEALRKDLLSNEEECKKLQEQIEWVSRRRAELKDEVRKGQQLYGEAAAELASNLAELQRLHPCPPEYGRVIDKPQRQTSITSLRHRKEPLLPRASPMRSMAIKSPILSTPVASQEIHSSFQTVPKV